MQEPRNNPDGSFYPADAFYYIIKFSASPTCLSLNVRPLEVYDKLNVEFHNISLWTGVKKSWPHGPNTGAFAEHANASENSVTYRNVSLEHYPAKDKDTLDWGYILQSTYMAHYPACPSFAYTMQDSSGSVIMYKNHYCVVPDKFIDVSSIALFEQQLQNKCGTFTVYSGCVFGKIVIDSDAKKSKCLFNDLADMHVPEYMFPANDTCIDPLQKIKQTITAQKQICNTIHHKIKCRAVSIPKTITLIPEIQMPQLHVNLTKVILSDSDGYDAQNLDGTHYIWDPVTILHVPEFKWKNSRNNTIQFTVEKSHTLNIENEITCQNNNCLKSLIHPGITTSVWSLGNGDDITVYNGTDNSKLGLHNFRYNVVVYNGDKIIAQNSSSIDGLIVQYDPVYSEYPYSLLSDDSSTAYENAAAVALHYFGSIGGGPDDTDLLHEDRRSKINHFLYTGYGYDPWNIVLFNDTLSWRHAQNVGIIDETSTVQSNVVSVTAHKDLVPCSVMYDMTAMMIKAGYCKVYFDYPILETIISPAGPQYENATLFNVLLSENFAGKSYTILSHYEYRFPESFFKSNLEIISVNSNGTIDGIELSASVHPNLSDGAVTISEYLYDKVVHDSADPGFADIISADVPAESYTEYGVGQIDLPLRRIASQFGVYTSNQNQSLAGLDIQKLSPLYFVNSNNASLSVPLDVGLGALSPLHVQVNASGESMNFTYDYVDFSRDRQIILNSAQNNTLIVERYFGSIVVRAPSFFGPITQLYLNDTRANTTCNLLCSVNVLDHKMIHITAKNQWGGMAHGVAEEFIIVPTPQPTLPHLYPLVLFVVSFIPVYFLYNYFKR